MGYRSGACPVGQGYLFSRPLPANEAAHLLSAHRLNSVTRAKVPGAGGLGRQALLRPSPRATGGQRTRKAVA